MSVAVCDPDIDFWGFLLSLSCCLGLDRARIVSSDDKVCRWYHAAHSALALILEEFSNAAAAETVSARQSAGVDLLFVADVALSVSINEVLSLLELVFLFLSDLLNPVIARSGSCTLLAFLALHSVVHSGVRGVRRDAHERSQLLLIIRISVLG